MSEYTRGVPGKNVNIPRGHSVGYSKKKVYVYMSPISKDF
jgi:hypothetical protein